MVTIGQSMGSSAIAEVHSILKRELTGIQKLLGCDATSFFDVKDLSSIIPNEVLHKVRSLNHEMVF